MAGKSDTDNLENDEFSTCKKVEHTLTEDNVGQISSSVESVDINPNTRVAKEVFHSWRKCSKQKQIFHKLKTELESRSTMIADIIVHEIGINYQEAMSDLMQGISIIDTAMYTLGRNSNIEEFSDGEYHREARKPLGVIAAILPYSSVVTSIMRTVVPALATGNCVIAKPSELTPRTIECIAECIMSAGVPTGAFQVLHGSMAVVHALCASPDVAAVSFFGSSAEAKVVFNRCLTVGKRVLAFGGAKNHVLALADCDVETTVQDIVAGFTACAGQRCLAVSVLILVSDGSESMHKTFMDSLVAEIVTLASRIEAGQKVGQFGPLINASARDRVIEYINEAETAGCKILLDGRSWATERTAGYWVGPTIILHSNSSDRAMKEEIFGPVLSVYCATSWDEAITIENSNPYGNAACVYTERGAHAEWFISRMRAGMLGVNECFPPSREPTCFSPAEGSLSKFGSHELSGDCAIDFFTTRVHVTARWVAPSVKAGAVASPSRVVSASPNASPTNTRRRGLVPIIVPQVEELPPVGPVRRTSSCTTKDLLLREDSTMTIDSEGDITVDQNEQPPSASKPATFRGIAATSPFASSDSQFDFNIERIHNRDDSFEPCYSAQPSVEFDPRAANPFERGISDISAVSNISNTLSRENSVVLQQPKKYFNVDLCAIQDIHEAHLAAVQSLVANMGPLETQYTYRASATRFIKKYLRKSLQCGVIETGMAALRCFLPTDPIMLSVILSGRLEPHWQNIARDGFIRLQNEGQDAGQQHPTDTKHSVKKLDIQKQGNDCKLHFLCDMTEVEISLNARNDVCLLAFFEEVDNLVGQDSLFKRSILLIRAWWEYETAEYFESPTTRQLLNESVICVMVCAIFNQHHTRIQSPLQALCLFLAEYSTYDGTTEVITLQGIVPLRSLDSHPALPDPTKKHLISSALLDKYWKAFQVEDVIRSRTSSCTSTSMMGSPLKSSADSVSSLSFIRDSFNVLHPFDGSNMVKTISRAQDRKFAPSKLNRAFLEGAKNISYALSKQVPTSTGSSELLDLFMPATKARFSLSARPDALPASSDSSEFSGPSSPSHHSSMAVSVDKLWQSIHYCNFIVKSVVTESAILTFCFDVLSMFGLLTADDLGKRLNDASKVPQVMVTLKEQVGGLKEFLKRYPDVFVFSYEHPYNPHVFLRMTLTAELQTEVENGILPVKFLTHIISKFGRIVPPPPKVDSPSLRRGKVMMQQSPSISYPSSAVYAINSGIVDERAIFGHERSADGDALRLMQADVDLASVNDAMNTPTSSKESDTSSLDKTSVVSSSGPHNPYAPVFVPQQQTLTQRALELQHIPVRKTIPLGPSQHHSLHAPSSQTAPTASPYYNDLGLMSSAVLGSGVSLSIGNEGSASNPVISSSSSVCSSNSRLQYSDTDMIDGFLDSNSDYFGDSLGTSSGHHALLSSLRDNSKEFSDMMLSDDYTSDIGLGVLSNCNNQSQRNGSYGSSSSDLYSGSGYDALAADNYHQAGNNTSMRGHTYPAQQAKSNPDLYLRNAGAEDYGHDGYAQGYGGYRDSTQHGGSSGYMYNQSQGPGQLHYGSTSSRGSLVRTNSRPLLIPPQPQQLGANNQKFQHKRYDVSSQYKNKM